MASISEKVIGFTSNVSQQVKDAVEPAALAVIEPNLDVLDTYVNPIVLSDPAKTFAGYAAGAWGTAAMMVVGLPDFMGDIMHGRIGLTQIAKDSWAMFKKGFTVWGDFAAGNYSSDPFARGQTFGESLAGAMLVACGAKALGKGAVSAIEAGAKAAAGSIPPAAALAGVGAGVSTGALSVSINGTAVAAAAGEMGRGLIFSQSVGEHPSEGARKKAASGKASGRPASVRAVDLTLEESLLVQLRNRFASIEGKLLSKARYSNNSFQYLAEHGFRGDASTYAALGEQLPKRLSRKYARHSAAELFAEVDRRLQQLELDVGDRSGLGVAGSNYLRSWNLNEHVALYQELVRRGFGRTAEGLARCDSFRRRFEMGR